ncbi:MAG: 4-chlorobenzoate--CoA ligase [Rhodospirillaceae bacterium]|nr:4-chlorobenzoate--CoA ligase [Rhodospirillaceae bacterium]
MFDLGRGFLASAERMPDAVAISDNGIRLTYAKWRDFVLRVTGGLDTLGLKAGDHLVTMLTNRLEAASLHIACQLAGIAITPLNWRAGAEELDYVLADADAKALVFERLTAACVAQSENAVNVTQIALDNANGERAGWDHYFKGEPADAVSRAEPETTSVMLYTSGTTGRSKGVPRSHAAERAAASAHVAQNLYSRGETTLGVMPLYHTMGVRSLLASIVINGHFVCQHRFDADQALTLIRDERISNLYLVPTLYHDLLAASNFSASDVSSVRKLGFAGQTMTDGLLKRLDEAFRPDLFVNHYGSSEIYTFTIEPNATKKPGSAGKAGLNQEIRVIAIGSTNPNETVDPEIEGQIIASLDGDESFTGYWKRPDADEKAMNSGWYFTGDIGYRDADGDLFVTGRVDDMIISGGENILPAEIESVLSLNEAVGEVAVVGIPHERLGQEVTAFISRRGAVDGASLDAWCLERGLTPYKRPRAYIFVKEIPKSPVGKILRRMLVAGEYQPE